MMGCTRIGCAFYFALWFALFGIGDPDRLARRVALVANIVIAGAIGIFGTQIAGLSGTEALTIAGIFLALISLPTLGVHYETAERSVNFFDVFVLFGAVFLYQYPEPLFLGAFVAGVVVLALAFKVTQFAPYGLVWFVLFSQTPSWVAFGWSSAGALSAFAVHLGILWKADLLHRENFGVFGYAAHGTPDEGGKYNNDIARRIETKLGATAVARLMIILSQAIGPSLTLYLYGALLGAKAYFPLVFGSIRGIVLMAMVGVLSQPLGPLNAITLAWLTGALIALLAQARFFSFHFIPLLLPLAILAGTGWLLVIDEIIAGSLLYLALGIVGFGLTVWDILTCWRGSGVESLDYRFWPPEAHSIIDKNMIAKEAAEYVGQQANETDFALVLGTLPQFYVLSRCRCPINWLSTNENLMDQILPSWKSTLIEKLKSYPPRFVLAVDGAIVIEDIEKATGLGYRREKVFSGKAILYRVELSSAPVGDC